MFCLNIPATLSCCEGKDRTRVEKTRGSAQSAASSVTPPDFRTPLENPGGTTTTWPLCVAILSSSCESATQSAFSATIRHLS